MIQFHHFIGVIAITFQPEALRIIQQPILKLLQSNEVQDTLKATSG